MRLISRRSFMQQLVGVHFYGCAVNLLPVQPAIAGTTDSPEVSAEEWMNDMMRAEGAKPLEQRLELSRFVEPMWFLLKPIRWRPKPEQAKDFPVVTAPRGFVTDLTSIPRVFWTLLPRDGIYTYPAIIHDYLYWTQNHPREIADMIIKLGMEDLKINAVTTGAVYQALNIFGGTAWSRNASLRKAGERRILRRLPEDPTTLWSDWKKNPDNFEP
jgi:hypothetical protein